MDVTGQPASDAIMDVSRAIGLRHGLRPEIVASVLQSSEAMRADAGAASQTREAEAELLAREQRLPPDQVGWILASYQDLREGRFVDRAGGMVGADGRPSAYAPPDVVERSVRRFVPAFRSIAGSTVEPDAVVEAMQRGAEEVRKPEYSHLPPGPKNALARDIAMKALLGPGADQRMVNTLAERMRECVDEARGAASRPLSAVRAPVEASRGKSVGARGSP